MRGERVTEDVRMHRHLEASLPRPVSHAQLHGPCAQTGPVPADEQGRFSNASQAGALLQPARDRLGRLAADRHDAFLAAFADHSHGAGYGAPIRLQVADFQPDQLG